MIGDVADQALPVVVEGEQHALGTGLDLADGDEALSSWAARAGIGQPTLKRFLAARSTVRPSRS
jgi:hypothetical protein